MIIYKPIRECYKNPMTLHPQYITPKDSIKYHVNLYKDLLENPYKYLKDQTYHELAKYLIRTKTKIPKLRTTNIDILDAIINYLWYYL